MYPSAMEGQEILTPERGCRMRQSQGLMIEISESADFFFFKRSVHYTLITQRKLRRLLCRQLYSTCYYSSTSAWLFFIGIWVYFLTLTSQVLQLILSSITAFNL
jgi:hypothetical protein